MANKHNFAGFQSAANERLGNITQKKSASSAPEDPYAKLSDEEKWALEAAVVNGYPEASEYAQNALARYMRLQDEAEKRAEAWHYKPKTQEYNDFLDRYISGSWGDDQILGVDQVRNMYNLYNTNQAAEQKRNMQDRLRFQSAANAPAVATGVAPAPSSSIELLTDFFNRTGQKASDTLNAPLPQVKDDWDPYSPDGRIH